MDNLIHLDDRRVKEINSVTELQDDPLHELLRKAVAYWRRAQRSTVGAGTSRSNRNTAYTYLDAISIVLGKNGVAAELSQKLSAGVFDIRKLAAAARDWDGPAGA